jgi:putative ABC transport system permease protein
MTGIRELFKDGYRSVLANKVFSLITVMGLCIGIASLSIAYAFRTYNLSFDNFHKDSYRIFRAIGTIHFADQKFESPSLQMPLLRSIGNNIKGVDFVVPIHIFGECSTIRVPGKATSYANQNNAIVFTSNEYFQVFNYTMIAGQMPTSLTTAFSVVLTESKARIYFPGEGYDNIIGKQIIYNDSIAVFVTGIVKDLTDPTNLTFKEFVSWPTIENSGLKYNMNYNDWGTTSQYTELFIKTAASANPDAICDQLNLIFKTNSPISLNQTFTLQPVTKIHMKNEIKGFEKQVDTRMLSGLLLASIILLLLACINFINLSTARAYQRNKEICVKKILGCSRNHLMLQFLAESFIVTLLAAFLSVLSIPIFTLVMSHFLPSEMPAEILHIRFLFFIGLVVISVTLLSGVYPAIILSNLNPTKALKSNNSKSTRVIIRKSLIVGQLTIAQGFIVASLIIKSQILMFLHKDLGFNHNSVIIINAPVKADDISGGVLLTQRINQINGVDKAILSGQPPISMIDETPEIKLNDGERIKDMTVGLKYGGSEYFNFYNIKLLFGRFPNSSQKIKEFAVNESFVRAMGFKSPVEAIGKSITIFGESFPVVGIIADFNTGSLEYSIPPVVFTSSMQNENSISVSLKPNATGTAWSEAISEIEKAWKKIYPETDFNFYFLDAQIDALYQNERDISNLVDIATILTMVIGGLGLFGLMIYAMNVRRKEIGIRKVLGASVMKIIIFIYSDFAILICISFLLASPITWWLMHVWLQNFAYRVSPGFPLFLLGLMIMLCMSALVLSFQIIRAAIDNPINSLRQE